MDYKSRLLDTMRFDKIWTVTMENGVSTINLGEVA